MSDVLILLALIGVIGAALGIVWIRELRAEHEAWMGKWTAAEEERVEKLIEDNRKHLLR
jgi:hypothetical protein